MTQVAEIDVSQRYGHHGTPPPTTREYLTRPGWVRATWMTFLFFGLGLGSLASRFKRGPLGGRNAHAGS